MKISKLLEKLVVLQSEHGDIDVEIADSTYPNADSDRVYYDDDSHSVVIAS